MGSSPVRSSLFLEYLHVMLCMLEDQWFARTDRIDTQCSLNTALNRLFKLGRKKRKRMSRFFIKKKSRCVNINGNIITSGDFNDVMSFLLREMSTVRNYEIPSDGVTFERKA